MADFTSINYVPTELIRKTGLGKPGVHSSTYIGFGKFGSSGGSTPTAQTLYRGTISGLYVYSLGSPPGGATNIVVIGEI